MYGWVIALLWWVPSAAAFVYLWRRKDISLFEFGVWTGLLLVPWLGVLAYVAWNAAPRATAVALVGLGVLSSHDIVLPWLDGIGARGWTRAPVESYDEGFEPGWDGGSTLSPRYTYAYRGKRYGGRRLSFMPRPWYASEYRFEKKVTDVFVNPGDPTESVVQRDIPGRALRRAGIALGVVAAASGLLWSQVRRRQSA